MNKPKVAIGIIGTRLDAVRGADRWGRWRPTVAICQQDDFVLDRFELMYQSRDIGLASQLKRDISLVSPETEVNLFEVNIDSPWDFQEVYGTFHDFAAGYDFDPEAEDYLVHITTGTHVMQICMFLLAESRHLPGNLLQSSPPRRTQSLGLDPGLITEIDLDLSKYDLLASRFEKERFDDLNFLKAGIETRNVAFNRMMEQIEFVSMQSREPVLLMGPTGAGKTQLAERIYELKKQKRQLTGKMVKVNCATLRGDGAMSALFGHIKGSFTGAMRDRVGFLKSADRGMLFLDEIGELGLEEQAMLLRAVEAGQFVPVGSESETHSDFQLICGTNRDLRALVRSGEFRSDLLARIDLWTYYLPGLSERREDIEPNLTYELKRHESESGRLTRFNKEAARRYLSFAESRQAVWAGNFRDLNASVTRMATLAASGRITEAVVDDEIARLQISWGRVADSSDDALLLSVMSERRLSDVDLFDRPQLAYVIRVCRASASLADAGRQLFQASREKRKSKNDGDRLRKYLAKFGLRWDEVLSN